MQEIKIGEQFWATINLAEKTFSNGEVILEAKTPEEWVNAANNKQPAWCYYENDPANENEYGLLYNWYAVSDPRGLAPNGWRIPSEKDWVKLIRFHGGGIVTGASIKAIGRWPIIKMIDIPCEECANWFFIKKAFCKCEKCQNTRVLKPQSTGFYALAGGKRNAQGLFGRIKEGGYWWCSTECNEFTAFSRRLYHLDNFFSNYIYNKTYGLSVRCIRNEK